MKFILTVKLMSSILKGTYLSCYLIQDISPSFNCIPGSMQLLFLGQLGYVNSC